MVTKTIDSFEGGDFSEYDSGHPVYFTIRETPSKSEHSCKGDGENAKKWMVSTGGLNYYPRRGDVIELWMLGNDTGALPNFGFGLQNSNFSSGYDAKIDFADNEFRLGKNNSDKATGNGSFDLYTWYRVKIDWKFDTISGYVYDSGGSQLASTSFSDGDYDGGNIGFRADHKSRPFWDEVKVTDTTYPPSQPTGVNAYLL